MSNRDSDNKATIIDTSQPSAIGYKRPPVAKRFRKGRSGNPKGRPKGRVNFANITRDLINAPIKVKIGDSTVIMPAGEAVLRKVQAEAGRGSYRHLVALLDIIEMTGRTDDVSDEERERRTLRLPKPMSHEEYDLVGSPARAKDRQRLLLRYEELDTKHCAPTGDPDRIAEKTGTHRSFIASMQPPGTMLPDPPRHAIRVGLDADRLLYAGDFAEAVRLAEEAIAKSPDCDVIWMQLIVAHARMFLGHAADSRAYYLSFRSDKSIGWTSWETIILQEFEKLRQAGHSHWLMNEIEQHLKTEGWTLKGGPAHKSKGQTVSAADREFMMMNPETLKTGGLLEQEGQSDKAAEVYRRYLKKARSKTAAGATDVSPADSEHAMQRLTGIAHQHLMEGHFGQAHELSRELLGFESNWLPAQAIEAQVLMLTGAGLEARAIFLKHRGQKIGTETWEDVILRDFEEHRKAYRPHALMDEISDLFGKPESRVASPETPELSPADEDAGLLEASDIQSGDRLFGKGRFKDALAVYCRYLDGWDYMRRATPNRMSQTAIANRETAVDRICDIAVTFIQNREFKEASKLAERALVSKQHSPRANIVKAHTLMLLGQTEEARTLYNTCSQERLDADRRGAQTILSDFATLREADLSHPLMDEIEAALMAPQAV